MDRKARNYRKRSMIERRKEMRKKKGEKTVERGRYSKRNRRKAQKMDTKKRGGMFNRIR